MVSAPSLIEGTYRRGLHDAAVEALNAERYDQAENALKFLIGSGVDDGYLLYVLGNVQYHMKRYADAVVALRQSVELDPANASALNDLGASLFALRRDAEALGFIRQFLKVNPAQPEAEETESIWLLRYGRFREGWQKYEARNRTARIAPTLRDFGKPQWFGEPIHDRTILLHAEQGMGDVIQFVRYAPLVAARGARVVLEVHPGLRAILTDLPGVSTIIENGEELPAFDLHCPLLSLPLAFDTDLDSIPASIPYVHTSPDRVFRWRSRLGPRRVARIGIAWSGNPDHRDDYRRSIPLGQFADLLADRPDREFHVMQNTIRESDVEALSRLPHVREHSRLLKDFADTAALVSLMDLVTSVDTSVAHLAGAMGWPVWLLLPTVPDWRWLLGRDDSPWYPAHWLFRQKRRDNWDDVLIEVARQLDNMLT